MEEELEKQIQADIEKYNSLRESGATMSEAFTEATKSGEQIINEQLENIKDNIYERVDDMRDNFSFEVEQFKADEGYGFGGGVNDSAIDNELDKFIEKYNSDIRDLENQIDSINKLDSIEDKQMFLDIYKEEGIEKAVDTFNKLEQDISQLNTEQAALESFLNSNDNREEIEKALESGIDIQDLVAETSRDEVIQVAQESDRFEVISEADFINSIQDQITEKLKEEALESGVAVSNEIDFGSVNDGAYSVAMSELENSSIDGVNILPNPEEAGDSLIIVDTEKVNFEEVKEAITNEVIEANRESFESDLTNGKSFEEAADMEKVLFNNAVEAIENAGYDKSAEGNAIDVVQEVATAGYDIEDSKLTDLVNEKFGTDLSESDINSIKEVAGKEMNGEIESMDHSKDLNMNDIKEMAGELSSQEIKVEGDHATIKEDTMAGEQVERVVDRETGLNEMDKAVGVDSDKVETKEESQLRDGLSTEDQKILDSFDKSEKEITLNDAMESFNSKPQNAELSQENEGQKNAESAKQK